MTATGIAKMAGVGRAAVSNWRRRHADFPLPVGGTAASPVFDAEKVEQWLQRQGKLHATSTEERLWRHLESVTPAADIGNALAIAGAYLLVESGERPNSADAKATDSVRLPTPKQLLARLRARDGNLADLISPVLPAQWSDQLGAILRTVATLRQEHDPCAVFEQLHARYAASSRSLSGLDVTPDAVAEIMLGLAGPGATIFDFTCGTGTILHTATRQALDRGVAIRCFAQEVKPHNGLITLLRLWFVHDRAAAAGLTAEPPVVRVGDSLLADGFAGLTAETVIANPPFGIHDWGHDRLAYDPRWTYGLPPRTEPELAWVQHGLSHLAPGGTAVVLMPPAAAARPTGRRIRGELVRQGALRAIIALPAGMLQPAAIGLHLWVLTNPAQGGSPGQRVLFVDSSLSTVARARTRRADAASVREIIERAWKDYRAPNDSAGEPGVYRAVSAVEVLDDEVDLTPKRYLPHANQGLDLEETPQRVQRLEDLLGELRHVLPAIKPTDSAPLRAAPTAAVADLIRSGGLSVHRAINRVRGDQTEAMQPTDVTVLTGLDVMSGGPPTGTLRQVPDRLSTTRVEPGDILIPVVAREIVARVATSEQVGAEVGLGVHAVRVNPELLDPWFLAGILSRSDNARIAGGVNKTTTGMMRIDVTRLTVPVLPIEVQRDYGDAFRRLAQFRLALGRVHEQGEDLARDLANGLATGVLKLGSA